MKSTFLSHIDLNLFGLDKDEIFEISSRVLLVKKWNWAYSKAHQFQRQCLNFLDFFPQSKIIICCSHPHVFTYGRGLQKPKKNESFELVDFNPALASSLPFPLFQIERGGGLTFHHPGQMIIYPILRLNPQTLSLSKMINSLFECAAHTLEDWGLEGLSYENKLLGLWYGDKKVASMGIAIEKLTTFHGMALNFYCDTQMKQALNLVNPCGLSAQRYTSVEELMMLKNRTLDEFAEQFLGRLQDAW